ncbi:hypothetical protein GSY74_04470 [Sulfurovum sp. bin170]|uniref:hypothetical protein n=1 Tax=Sulfurovum sp. bin170 TaxID=2695268 RepID=UPI0013DF2830|nr:hypothetical protein [Sulfurovum sp. bin170]NEW60530.1 hypothetical protein [Sulfurovum sp. bin170]
MKLIIDLIEDIRESIQNDESYIITAMLLKEDENDKKNLIYAGEAPISSFEIDKLSKELILIVEKDKELLSVGELLKHLFILDTKELMYEVKLAVSQAHNLQELVGFGFNSTDKKYALFMMQ